MVLLEPRSKTGLDEQKWGSGVTNRNANASCMHEALQTATRCARGGKIGGQVDRNKSRRPDVPLRCS